MIVLPCTNIYGRLSKLQLSLNHSHQIAPHTCMWIYFLSHAFNLLMVNIMQTMSEFQTDITTHQSLTNIGYVFQGYPSLYIYIYIKIHRHNSSPLYGVHIIKSECNRQFSGLTWLTETYVNTSIRFRAERGGHHGKTISILETTSVSNIDIGMIP